MFRVLKHVIDNGSNHKLKTNNFTLKFLNNAIRLLSDTKMERPWREASSLIIASRLSLHDVIAKGKNLANVMGSTKWNYTTKQNVTDYRLLMVKRSGLSSFMANAYVFPGGLVEVADYSPLWWIVFEKLGITRGELMEFCTHYHGPRPPIIKNPLTLESKGAPLDEDYLPPDIALRIAALRETFEETGILLLTNPALETTQEAMTHTLLTQNINIQMWQEKIHKDPHMFIDLCLESHMCPDIWSLYEWSDWLTPTSVGHRRYDTMFYLCCLPRQPDVLLDKGEVTVMRWCTPEEMLEDNSTHTVFLAPPQVYELSRLIPLQSYHELKQFAKKREPNGCERWMPIIATAIDGAVSLLPGDDLFPEEPDYEGVQKPVEFPHALEDLRSRSKNLHRMEIRGPQCTMYCNVSPSCGHLQPLTYKSSQPVIQSFL
ncbi:nucleoside diphosphate-linked moiety X motif 19-like isoform X1 [Stegodyphus dumicola]|uniref:nucleoside diphosphate-linked moiety X motif 19-like isoform X1 n=2 Tax=Stegodyphus dumicola TaxID=202533 RepID=UPI0015AE0C4D|nr:nucleoside diphosphate-linked moiety X motif 19-like isoform X1 [Stegodyphus dumicola]